MRGIERVNDTWTSIESPRGRRNIFSSVVTRSVIYICMQAFEHRKKTYTPSIESFEIGKVKQNLRKKYRSIRHIRILLKKKKFKITHE